MAQTLANAGQTCHVCKRIRKSFVRQLLDPVPGLEFYPLQHRYRLWGEWLPYNVSNVLSFDMSHSVQRAAIERTKDGPDGWAVRGKTIHRVLCDEFLLGHDPVYDEKWAPWIEPLLEQPLFKGGDTGAEYAVCDKIKRVGGSFDFLLRTTDPNDKRVILGDLKTVSSKGSLQQTPSTCPAPGVQELPCSASPFVGGDRSGYGGLRA